ncbi:MAG: T9SS type A sorting domain-containing protein [Bacteroidetes bacterium]|nr:T9SS type A sorting domain-containing protein [Bacteroidota bacterium]
MRNLRPQLPETNQLCSTTRQILADQYLWIFGDSTFSTDINPMHTFTTPGNYNVCLYAANSCEESVVCQNVNVLPTSIREIEQGIFVSPNPAKDNMFVTFSNENNVWKKFEILDITGRVILSNVINNSRLEIDLKGIVDGVYVITLLSPNEPSHSVKFVIQGNN